MNNDTRPLPPHVQRSTRSFLYLCTAFCLGFFVWASCSELDIVSEAIGEVTPQSGVQRVQHLEGGIIRDILVKEGDQVKEGQPLVALETTATDASVEELEVRVASLMAEIARLEAEARMLGDDPGTTQGISQAPPSEEESAPVNATAPEPSANATVTLAVAPANATEASAPTAEDILTPLAAKESDEQPEAEEPISPEEAQRILLDAVPVFPDELTTKSPDLVSQTVNLFEARRRRLINDMNTQAEKIIQREQDIAEISSRIRNLRRNLSYVNEQISISEELLKDQLTTRYKHLAFLKEATSLRSRIEEDSAALERARSALSAARENLDQIRNTFREDVQNNLERARREYLEFSQRMRRLGDNLDRTVIRSPSDGVVKILYVVNEGEVVRPGMTIMDVVPAGDRLVVEAHLPIQDIGYVAVGQAAMIKLASREARRFGTLEGRVVNISPDAITTSEGGTFYKVLVETDRDYFEYEDNRYVLYPGMRVIVGILTGQRTVLEYLLYPYFDNLFEGLRER